MSIFFSLLEGKPGAQAELTGIPEFASLAIGGPVEFLVEIPFGLVVCYVEDVQIQLDRIPRSKSETMGIVQV